MVFLLMFGDRMNKPAKKKRCKACGEDFTPMLSTAKVCSMACALDHVKADSAKKQRKESVKRKKEFLDNDIKFQKAKAQKVFNEYIRLRDAGLGCVSCDKGPDWHGQWHAGHYKTVGARADLRFNEDNCHKQCSVCNNHLSGNLVEYRNKLIYERIGMARVQELETEWKPNHYRAEDYREITKKYAEKVKLLKQSQQ